MPIINLTEAAAAELKRVWAEQELPPTAILVMGVRGGGCSGFQYVLNITEEVDETKHHIEEVQGIKVAVDKRSALYITGTTVDYHTDLTKRGFVFNNPTSKGTCGCGSSFNV